ncbi:MAG: type II toxin-antitoxin system PemK/MazF family toxin [Chloroflexota bacterium]|nr:type II toxin-antitoxin system PemK/MazF family toxin [Chloroflexota bacterium]
MLVRFPFSNGVGGKQRPAIVVSSDRYNQTSPDVMIASITSNLHALSHPGDHPITDWNAVGLLTPSLAQTKVATIEQSMIRRRLGRLGSDDWAAVEQGLRVALGFL